MTLTASTDKTFLSKLEQWLLSQPEVLVLIRYANSAGSKSYEFFSSYVLLIERLRQLPPRTSVIVFKQAQLPIRGIVNDAFIEHCLLAIPDGSEFLVVETEKRTYGKASWFHNVAGETHAELCEALEESRGNPVAVGTYPDWLETDSDALSSYVPDMDGTVRCGAY
jgi:hypothetical protein